MGLIRDGDMARLRINAERALSDTCIVVRDTITPDPFSAAGSATPGTVATYACRVRALESHAVQEGIRVGLQVQTQQVYAITLPHDATVRAADRIEYQSQVFEVSTATQPVTDTVLQRVFALESE